MQAVNMEIFCFLVLVFISLMFYVRLGNDLDSPMHTIFGRLVNLSMISILFEFGASLALERRDRLTPVMLVIILMAYHISLLAVLYFAYLYTRKLINNDLPDKLRIRGYSDWIVGGVLIIAAALPIIFVRIDGENVTFDKAVLIVYGMLLSYELYIMTLFILKWKHVNPRRRRIIALAYICQAICLIVQVFNRHKYITGLAVVVAVLSFYMTLDNADVRLVEQLSSEKEKADRANKSKSDFIANVSHEIRTPINAVLGMDEMILRETKEEATRQYAFDIKSAATTLHGIINEILDMSKMETGRMDIVPVNYNMRSLINDTINMIKLKSDAKNLELKVSADPKIPAGYVGDEVRIKQILTNILSNSVKYTEEGSISLDITGERSETENNKEILHFVIKDTGIGMRPEDVKKITEDYSRFDSEKNRNVEGTGLGMSITTKLLSRMGATLNIESEYGSGTTMSFDLEQEIWDASELGDYRNANYVLAENYVYEQSFEAPECKVLVVDDNAVNRKVFRGLLRKTKLNIDEADSGSSCLNMVRKNKYDIIFMDHMMPEMDGIETFHALKELPDNMSKDAPCIMLTANAVSGAKELYFEEGFDDFIAKPIVPDELEKLIKKYLPEESL